MVGKNELVKIPEDIEQKRFAQQVAQEKIKYDSDSRKVRV